MGIIFNFDDVKKMQLGDEITFGNLNFIIDQLRNLHQQESKASV
jgi:hypothetical protein